MRLEPVLLPGMALPMALPMDLAAALPSSTMEHQSGCVCKNLGILQVSLCNFLATISNCDPA